MYQFKVGPKSGSELTAQRPEQHRTNQVNRDSSNFSLPLFYSSVRKRTTLYRIALALVTGCFFVFLSGCGGLTLNSSSITKGSTAGSGSSSTVTISTLSCGTQSLTGAQSKACSVYLSAPATSATSVSLTSSNGALKVPASIVVPAGAKTGGFIAVSATVNQPVSVTITGKAGGVAKTNVITLYPAPAATATLSKVSCGTQTLTGPTSRPCSVYLSTAATSQTVVSLSSSNSALAVPISVTVPSGSTTGGFVVAAAAVSTTQSATLTATEGGVSQSVAFQLVGSGGSGSTQHHVQLSWAAPGATPSDPLAGYHVYRATAGTSSYQLLNSSIDTSTTYNDSSVQSGQTYDYVVKSVDTGGVESAPSNMTSVSVP
jgi:hypothetical protein